MCGKSEREREKGEERGREKEREMQWWLVLPGLCCVGAYVNACLSSG